MTPPFDADVNQYSLTTSNATNKVSAEADAGVEINIKLGDTTVKNGESISWAAGENILRITTTDGSIQNTYIVIVTKQ